MAQRCVRYNYQGHEANTQEQRRVAAGSRDLDQHVAVACGGAPERGLVANDPSDYPDHRAHASANKKQRRRQRYYGDAQERRQTIAATEVSESRTPVTRQRGHRGRQEHPVFQPHLACDHNGQ